MLERFFFFLLPIRLDGGYAARGYFILLRSLSLSLLAVRFLRVPDIEKQKKKIVRLATAIDKRGVIVKKKRRARAQLRFRRVSFVSDRAS